MMMDFRSFLFIVQYTYEFLEKLSYKFSGGCKISGFNLNITPGHPARCYETFNMII